MIRKVRFSNFYSFKSEQEISFLATKKKSYDYFASKSGDQITKVAGFIGGNASGKTNIMRLFTFLSYFACASNKEDSAETLNVSYKTFFNNSEPSKFSIEYEQNKSIYFYDFEIQKNKVVSESLHTKKIERRARKINVFTRKLDKIEELNKAYFEDFSTKFLKNIRSDVSLIAFLKSHYNIEIINSVYKYFAGFKTNINERGDINNYLHQIGSITQYLDDNELKKKMEEFVCNFDIGLDSFEIEEEEVGDKIRLIVQGVHSTKMKNNKLDFSYESRGTQSLFFALSNILSGLRENNIIIIDEIESGFHPEALSKLISYFIDENSENCAQLIFSSHSLGFLNILDMHQIYLSEKNDNSESSAYRLNQIKNIRSDENFLSKYMTGAYGAFPKIRV